MFTLKCTVPKPPTCLSASDGDLDTLDLSICQAIKHVNNVPTYDSILDLHWGNIAGQARDKAVVLTYDFQLVMTFVMPQGSAAQSNLVLAVALLIIEPAVWSELSASMDIKPNEMIVILATSQPAMYLYKSM